MCLTVSSNFNFLKFLLVGPSSCSRPLYHFTIPHCCCCHVRKFSQASPVMEIHCSCISRSRQEKCIVSTALCQAAKLAYFIYIQLFQQTLNLRNFHFISSKSREMILSWLWNSLVHWTAIPAPCCTTSSHAENFRSKYFNVGQKILQEVHVDHQ